MTLIITGFGYFISGPKAAAACIVVGIIGTLILHFASKKEGEPSSKEARPSMQDSFNSTNRNTATGGQVRLEQHFHGVSLNPPLQTTPPSIIGSLPHPEIILSTEWPAEGLSNAHEAMRRFVDPLNHHERPFIVSNESEIVAHNVKIRDIEYEGKRATFQSIALVRKGEDKPCVPHVLGNVPIFQSRSLAPLFADIGILDLASGSGEVKMHRSFSVFTDYEDIHGEKWETEQGLTYDLWHKTAELRLLYCGPKRP